MTLLVFIAAIAVSAILAWQKDTNRRSEDMQALRRGRELARMVPGLPVLEAALTAYVGLFIATLGAVSLAVMLDHPSLYDVADMGNFIAVLIGGGGAMVVIGVRILRAHSRAGTLQIMGE